MKQHDNFYKFKIEPKPPRPCHFCKVSGIHGIAWKTYQNGKLLGSVTICSACFEKHKKDYPCPMPPLDGYLLESLQEPTQQ